MFSRSLGGIAYTSSLDICMTRRITAYKINIVSTIIFPTIVTRWDAPSAPQAVQRTHPATVQQKKAPQEAAHRAYGGAEAAAYEAAHGQHAVGAAGRVPQGHIPALAEGSHTHALRDNLEFAGDILVARRMGGR